MAGFELDLADVVTLLEAHHGRPSPPETTSPFGMVVLENCAYLVKDERRLAVFRELKRRVGIEPGALLAAPEPPLLEILQPGGMHPDRRLGKNRHAAAIADELGTENLDALVREDPKRARKTLKRFPGIGDPGADRILLFNHSVATLAPDSNALRVLLRLGFGEESKSYSRTYRSVSDAVRPLLPDDFPWLVRAHQLLRLHGQETCRRSRPECQDCPLTDACAWFAANA